MPYLTTRVISWPLSSLSKKVSLVDPGFNVSGILRLSHEKINVWSMSKTMLNL